MTRDINFARDLLLAIEAKPDTSEYRLIPGEASGKEIYHVEILDEAGLIKAKSYLMDTGHTKVWGVERLTWQGHEFLDAAKNETIWSRAQKYVQEKGGAVTFEVLKAVLSQLALKQVIP